MAMLRRQGHLASSHGSQWTEEATKALNKSLQMDIYSESMRHSHFAQAETTRWFLENDPASVQTYSLGVFVVDFAGKNCGGVQKLRCTHEPEAVLMKEVNLMRKQFSASTRGVIRFGPAQLHRVKLPSSIEGGTGLAASVNVQKFLGFSPEETYDFRMYIFPSNWGNMGFAAAHAPAGRGFYVLFYIYLFCLLKGGRDSFYQLISAHTFMHEIGKFIHLLVGMFFFI
jgi:hypothetical protein